MNPVVLSLDKLQSEEAMYMGVLIATLLLLEKLMVLSDSFLKDAQPLLEYLLENPLSTDKSQKGFKARFCPLFSQLDLLLATAIHPLLKMTAVQHANSGMANIVRNRLLKVIKELAFRQ